MQEQQDALDEQLDKYKEIIETRKDILDTEKDEIEYQEEIADHNKSIATLQHELALLALDDSAESKARQLELQEELNEELEDLAETQRDHSYEMQKEALDEEYEAYEEIINQQKEAIDAQKAALEIQIELLQTQIDLIDEYLSKPGLISQDALDILESEAPELYQSLIEWNEEYGSGIDEDVTRAWNEAYEALERYASLIEALRGESEYDYNPNIPFTEENLFSAEQTMSSRGSNIGNSTRPSPRTGNISLGKTDMLGVSGSFRNLMGNMQSTNIAGGNIQIGSLITIEGNVDKDVMPSLENVANEVIKKINRILLSRGFNRGTQLTSI